MRSSNVLDIMMPFYGDIRFFKLAVESVLRQSDPNWRLVIVDDLYPDPAAGEWAASLDDVRVHYRRNKQNLGVSGNFARCVDLAESAFMVIMGCDDLLLPNYVERVQSLIGDFPDVSYVQPGVQVIDENGVATTPLPDLIKRFYRPRVSGPDVLSGERLALSLLRGNWTYFPSIAWRTSIIKEIGFRPDLDVVLDLALQMRIVSENGSLVVDKAETSYAYRRHAGSVSSWTAGDGTRFSEEAIYFMEVAATMRDLGWVRASRAARWHVSSRLNELASVPRAMRGAGARSALGLAVHAMSPRAGGPWSR